MSEEPKIFTKSQLVEKLTEVAKKQKEKNDLVLNQKDEEIAKLTSDLNNAIESLNNFKKTQEDILNNVNMLSETNKKLSEENNLYQAKIADLENQIKNNINENNAEQYINFFNTVSNLINDINNLTNKDNQESQENISNKLDKKPKKTRKKSEELNNIQLENNCETNDNLNKDAIVEESQIVEEINEINNCDDDSIDVDALLSDL